MRNKIWPLSTNCLSVLEYFVGFALQGLKPTQTSTINSSSIINRENMG